MVVHPAARAGPTLRVIMASGKFQGVMSRLGPTDWRTVASREFIELARRLAIAEGVPDSSLPGQVTAG
jgi:hypothetical protein